MTKTKEWFLILALWALIIFGIFAFYWLLVRPGNIRKMCAEKARQVSVGTKAGLSGMLEINRAVYLDCLRCNGIDS